MRDGPDLFAGNSPATVPNVKRTIVTIAIVVGLLGIALVFALNQGRVTCEVCVSFQGLQLCERSSSVDQAEALMQAKYSACSQISSGVTDGIQCNNSRPLSSECSDR
jgi:hypothetical protein